jgi:hypothetical protein
MPSHHLGQPFSLPCLLDRSIYSRITLAHVDYLLSADER